MENFREYEPLNYLINLMPKKAQRGLTSLNVDWISMDVNTDFIAIGVNFGMVFLHNRKDRQMTRIKCRDKSGKITALKMLNTLDHQIAVGTSTGTLELHLIPKPGRPQQVEMFSLKAHKSQVTCIEWSTNGMKLYSGDNQGVIVCTQVDFYERNCTTLVILKESDPVVQLSYARKSLLISTWSRTVIFESESKSIKQVGQQPRKCKGTFGANFIPAVCKASDAKFYLSRPGLRLWRSDIDGKVEETLLFKDLINLGYPQLNLLEGTPSLIQDGHSETQFGPVIMYKETLVISWSYSSLFILDPINKKVIGGCAGSLGSIMGVSVVGDEIFILTRGAGRPIVRLACSPEIFYSRPPGHTQFTMEELQILQKQNKERILKEESQQQTDTNPEHKSKVLKFLGMTAKINIEKLEQKLKHSPKHSPTLGRKGSAIDTDGQAEETPATPAVDLSDDLKELTESPEHHLHEETLKEQITNGVDSHGSLKNDKKENFEGIGKESFEDDLVYSDKKKKKKKKAKKKEKGKKIDDKSSLSDFSIISSEIALVTVTDAHTDEELTQEPISTTLVRENIESLEKDTHDESLTSENISQEAGTSGSPEFWICHNNVESSHNNVEPLYNSADLSHNDVNPSHNDIKPSYNEYSHSNGHSRTTDRLSYIKNDLSKDDGNAINLDVGTLSSKQIIGSCDDNVLHQNILPTQPSPERNDFNSVFDEPSISADEADSLSVKIDNIPRDNLPSFGNIYDLPNTPDNSKSFEGKRSTDQESTSSCESFEVERKDDFIVPEGIQQKVAGSWMHCDTPGVITQLIMSDKHIWCVDNHDKVHFKLINPSKNKWDKLCEPAQQMAVSHTESIVWRVHRKTGIAYASAPITPRSPIGTKWAPACHDVCYVSLDETIAWIVKTNHDVYVQQDLSRDRVCSRSIKVSSANQIKLDQVITSRGVAWGRVIDGTLVYRLGITDRKPTGNQWVQFDDQSFDVVSMALDSRNTGWVIDQDGNVWFKTGVTMETPQGDTQHWWQVRVTTTDLCYID